LADIDRYRRGDASKRSWWKSRTIREIGRSVWPRSSRPRMKGWSQTSPKHIGHGGRCDAHRGRGRAGIGKVEARRELRGPSSRLGQARDTECGDRMRCRGVAQCMWRYSRVNPSSSTGFLQRPLPGAGPDSARPQSSAAITKRPKSYSLWSFDFLRRGAFKILRHVTSGIPEASVGNRVRTESIGGDDNGPDWILFCGLRGRCRMPDPIIVGRASSPRASLPPAFSRENTEIRTSDGSVEGGSLHWRNSCQYGKTQIEKC